MPSFPSPSRQNDRRPPETHRGTRNRALLLLSSNFLARRSVLAAIRNYDLKLTSEGALERIIRKSETDQ